MCDLFSNWTIEERYVPAYKYLYYFARFEGALKRAGYLNSLSDYAEAKPDWDRFARDIESEFSNSKCPETKSAIEYLRTHPPKKEIVLNGKTAWQDAHKNISEHISAQEIFVFVRRVRNNLFHGSKFNLDWFDADRSKKLIKCALDVLRAGLNCNHKVRQAFESE
jgi:hypothetical protein